MYSSNYLIYQETPPIATSALTRFSGTGGYNETMDIIYIDEVFLLNVLADYLLLLSAATLRALPLKRRRLAMGAALGGAYAVLALLPPLRWLQGGGVKLAVSAAMSAAAFGWAGFWRSWLCFLLLSAAFAGAFLGCGALGAASLPALLSSFALLYALLRLGLARQWERSGRRLLAAEVTLGGKQLGFTALHDTGNALFDAVTGRHVLIAEAKLIAPLLPCPLSGDAAEDLRALAGFGSPRLLPYRSVGGSGLLLCLRPEKLTLDGREQELLLGLSPAPFAENGEYQAIV